MKKTLRLTWRLDTAGYHIEERLNEPELAERSVLSEMERPRQLSADVSRIITELYADRKPRRGKHYVIRNGGPLREYSLETKESKRVSLRLANIPIERDEPQAVLSFANEWGLLTDQPEVDVSEFYAAANKLWTSCYSLHMGYLQFSLPRHHRPAIREGLSEDGITIERVPENLQDYCWYELWDIIGTMKESGSSFKLCDYCRGFYVPRLRAGNSRFCNHNDDKCKHAFHNYGGSPKGHTGLPAPSSHVAGT